MDHYREWVEDIGRVPSEREIIRKFPSLFARCRKYCFTAAKAFLPTPTFVPVDEQLRMGWQTAVYAKTQSVPNRRKITFVVDPNGNTGKTWLCLKMMSVFPARTQMLGIGKRDDLAYAIDETKNLFLVDVPRNQMVYLQYSVLEMIKNGVIFSPKYESGQKIMTSATTVIVFSNESPDMNALSSDRYDVINVN